MYLEPARSSAISRSPATTRPSLRRSRRIDLPIHHWICGHLFGSDEAVPVDRGSNTLAQPTSPCSSPKHITSLFTNGSTDPWSKLSISAANGNAVNPNVELYTVDGGSPCQRPDRPQAFGLRIRQGGTGPLLDPARDRDRTGRPCAGF